MNISPVLNSLPRYPSLAAGVACGLALSLSSCSCPACGGSGLQLLTPDGKNLPYSEKTLKNDSTLRTVRCVRCSGSAGVLSNDYWEEIQVIVNHIAESPERRH